MGAVINKKPDQNLGRTVVKGFTHGALGGYLIFESKRLVRKFGSEKNYNYIWPSKIVNAAGSSIIENAAANRELWERWHLNLGFNHIEVDFKDKFKVSYRIMPFSLLRTLYLFSKARLDIDRSMVFGILVFNQETPEILEEGRSSRGKAYLNHILLRRGMHQSTEAHEIIHTYQYEGFSGINTFFDSPMSRLEQKSKLARIYNKIFYTDFNAVFSMSIYNFEWERKGYWENYFEKEARFFSY
ncbi:hypothetical protein [Zunongwangia sp. H14]|uniref:hypothetical protein n=1 Tax=Zunongwangia sp. H14 TaxID=3240792 RepID=UPI0035632D85